MVVWSVEELRSIRTYGRVAGGLSMACAVITLYALGRLLTSSAGGNKHHPKLTGTHRYFAFLCVCISGDCLTAMAFSVFSIALPLNTNRTMSTNLPGADNPACVAQGFVHGLGDAISIVFSSLGAIEMYNLRPQLTNTNVYNPTIPFWQRRLTIYMLLGVFVVVVQVSLAGGLYGFGDMHPGSKPWCWIKNIHGNAAPSIVGIYALAFTSIFIICGSFVAYLRHLQTKVLTRGGRLSSRARRTFAKLSVYPFIYLVSWIPAFTNRIVGSAVDFSMEDKIIIYTVHIIMHSSLGTLNFLFLSCMNRQVRNFLPGWRYCCVLPRKPIDDRGTRTARSESRLDRVIKVWDSSSDEEEEVDNVEVINPVMEMSQGTSKSGDKI